jgi:4-hydroxythreonine-4-phosphate dehydrogenase
MKNKIIILTGDPNSINSEIIYKAWKKFKPHTRKKIYLIGNYDLIQKQFNVLGIKKKLFLVRNIEEKSSEDQLKIINIDIDFQDCFKVSMNESSKLVIKSLDLAHKLGLQENVSGIINCPINKLLLKKRNVGVTEYLASKCKINDGSEVMLIRNKKLSVSPITTHIDIKNIAKKINSKIILRKILEIERWFKKNLKRKTKIAVLGLNPHNAELRKDSEENRILIPAISKLKKLKVNVSGPFVTDTIFISEYKKYDVIVGMYHDQVLAPFKTLFKFDAINITLGLSYLRVSPDHGVALDLIGKNKANSTSLVNCIKFINQI